MINKKTFAEDLYCPFHASRRDWLRRRIPMSRTCPTCPMATNIKGRNPQDGGDIDNWGCAITHNVMLHLENIKLGRSTLETLDKKLNELARLQAQGILTQIQSAKLNDGDATRRQSVPDQKRSLEHAKSEGVQMDLIRDTELAEAVE